MKYIAITLIGIASVLGLSYTMANGLKRAERVECYEWHRQSQQFVGFYLTEWQKAQCDHHGINIVAPVR